MDTSRYMYVVQLSQLLLVLWNWNYAENYTNNIYIIHTLNCSGCLRYPQTCPIGVYPPYNHQDWRDPKGADVQRDYQAAERHLLR